MRRTPSVKTFLIAIVWLLATFHADAADYLWVGPTNGNGTAAVNWNTAANWTNLTTGASGYPNAASNMVIVQMNGTNDFGDSFFGIAMPTTFTAATIGGLTISNRSTHLYGSAYVGLAVPSAPAGALRVLNFDNGALPSVLQMDLGSMNFGGAYPDNNGGYRLDVVLKSKVLIVTNGNYTYGGGDVAYGRNVVMGGQNLQANTTLSGGTVAAPCAVIVQAGTNQGSAVSFSVGGTNTGFIGTWTVDGPKSSLSIGRDASLGTNSLNSVTLKNGGTLAFSTKNYTTWTLANRAVLGAGTVTMTTNRLLTVGDGGRLVPGDSNAVGTLTLVASNVVMTSGSRLAVELGSDSTNDLLAVTLRTGASMTLGGTLDVSLVSPYQPSAAGSWTILRTANGPIEGAFDTTNLPSSAFSLSVLSNEVHVTYTPRGTTVMVR